MTILKEYGTPDPDTSLRDAILAAYPDAIITLLHHPRVEFGRPCRPAGMLQIDYIINNIRRVAKQTFGKIELDTK